MNLLGLSTIAVIFLCALLSPFLIAWGIYCLIRPPRRIEGFIIIGSGLLLTICILVVGYLTAPENSPGLFRFQAISALAGYFGFGALIGYGIYRWRIMHSKKKTN